MGDDVYNMFCKSVFLTVINSLMRVKIIFLLFFIGSQTVFLSQINNSPGAKTSGNNILTATRLLPQVILKPRCGLNYTYASNPLFGAHRNNFTLSVTQPSHIHYSVSRPAALLKSYFIRHTSGTALMRQASPTHWQEFDFSNDNHSLAPKTGALGGSYTTCRRVTHYYRNGNYIICGILKLFN